MSNKNHSWYINKIIVDSREKVRGNHAYNYYIDDYNVSIEQLQYGDYFFATNDGKQIIFEYKTYEDFINSMEDNSLFNELSNQTIHFQYSYLVVVGDMEETFKNIYFNVPYYRYKYKTMKMLKSRLPKQIKGAFNRIYSMYIPIVFAEDENEAFEKMLNIASKIADSKKYGGIVRPSPKKELEEVPCAVYLTTINGIGEVKAKNIANELDVNCLNDLCKLKPSDFQSVDKVTDKNVCDIWKRIHNEKLEL